MRKTITSYRENEIRRFIPFQHRAHLEMLEARYGKFLYLPLDVPSIDLGQPFADWYMEHSKPIHKIASDIAGDLYDGPAAATFRSIDVGPPTALTIWERNHRDDVVSTFPAIQVVLDALPFDRTPAYSLWSSQYQVKPHRDQGCWFDFPCSFRSMLFDSNPVSTLSIRESPTTLFGRYRPRPLPRPTETHTFAWSNMRTLHQSFHMPGHLKILLIVQPAPLNLDKYNDLMERSILKYLDRAIISTAPQSDFIETT
jgi:hypothetical protein